MTLSVHLDSCGGVAGDMFAAAMLDAFPALEEPLRADLAAALGGLVEPVLRRGTSGGLAALRVRMTVQAAPPPTGRWRDIRDFLLRSGLDPTVKERALAIFGLLAEAEAHCHGVPVEEVHFHEVADWDSLADIAAAASLVHHAGLARWSVQDVPMGEGTVTTAHGLLPLPAPATASGASALPPPGPRSCAIWSPTPAPARRRAAWSRWAPAQEPASWPRAPTCSAS
jgi:uncharacterized protein (DUF111 family)